MAYVPSRNLIVGAYPSPTSYYITGNLADLRVSNVARYTGSSYTVPNVADGSGPFVADSSTLLLLKSLGGQVGTTLEVQGRGLNAVSLGATRSVQSYPPAPMSSYLLDTSGNTAVSYGVGKYVASASSEYTSRFTYLAFDKSVSSGFWQIATAAYTANTPYSGSIVTVDLIGNAYPGEWIQIQLPVSVILSTYSVTTDTSNSPSKWSVLGSRDGINWTLVDQRTGQTSWTNQVAQTFTASATQSYTFYRFVVNTAIGVQLMLYEWTLNGTEESLCITSDSKVGVGIANPQRALEVAGDLVVSGTISGGAGMGSFRNRIINGDMRINQRGVTSLAVISSASPTQYLTDRWRVATGATTGYFTISQVTLTASDTPYTQGVSNVSLRVTATVGNSSPVYIYPIYQIIEGYNFQDFNWGTSFGQPATMSFWFRSNMPTGSVVATTIKNMNLGGTGMYNAVFTSAGSGVWQYVTLTVPPPPNGSTWATGTNASVEVFIGALGGVGTPLGWVASTATGFSGQYPWWQFQGTYVEATGVQLEKGTLASPFEFRPYATELALCQRYYQVIGQNQGATTYFGTAFAYTTSAAYLALPLGVSMRTAPTSLTSNTASAYKILATGIGGTAVSSITLTSTSSQTAGLQIGTGAVLTAGQGVLFYTDNPTTTLGFNAEL